MKKNGAALAVLLAGVMSMGVIATAGCKEKEPHKHKWTAYTVDENGHYRTTTCEGHEPISDEDTSHIYLANSSVCIRCNYDYTTGSVIGKPEDPDDPVTLSEDTAISLTVGESKEISAAEGAVFTSQQPTVATVDSNGKITAKTAGVAKIKATADGSEITCTVIVLDKLGGNSQAAAKDPFTFNQSVNIGDVSATPGTPEVSDPNAAEFKVEFSDGIAQNVANGCTVVEPVVEKDGKYLTGWRSSGANTDYDFSTPVTSNLVLNAQWANLPAGIDMLQGNYESIAVEFSGKAATSTVSYKLHGTSDSWKEIDSELIRDAGGSVRADILGLKAGVYDVKVNNTEITGGVHVKAYDRSGYAHFNYTDGIGAYKDDGTLKENALVIYVTDENKDTVMRDLDNATVKAQMFDIPYYEGISGATKNWNKQAEGIGWWLNNVQYTKKDKNGKVNSNTFSDKGSTLGFGNTAFDNIPILIRFIGTVTTPEGCTAYNSLGEGGSTGDNGHMARMKNLKNVTLEGVGDDAEIKGWGFHFMAGSDAKNGRGKGFEVRNLTFNEYPEDAVGMEGVQSGSTITGSVERCWIHNNTFLPGYCANPAESDKKEGDGSCDFKRGMYFTCSYNYFEYCHKTNLVGSSDSSLQYNMTYHHNIWYQCGSRIPLTRQANVHFYNNYVFGDPAEKSTPYSHIAKPSLSYVHSLRANCYLFSEANYYEGCKNINDGKNGGASKFYGNSFYACSDTKSPVSNVAARTQTVSSNCAYNGTSFENFDTNPTLFYYDATAKKTKTEILDDSVGARIRTTLYAGALGHSEVTAKLQQMNTSAPVTSPSITKATKGKGQVITFSVSANTTLTIDATGLDPQVIRNDGKVILEPFSGERTVMLDAGVYMVCAGTKDKEVTINSMSVKEDSAAAKQARIEAAKKAIQAIDGTITRSSSSSIEKANQAYANLLSDEEKDALGAELTERLKKAKTAYEEILVAYAIARINYIGTVTEYSEADIKAAVAAYKAVSADSQSKVTNYNKLTEAQTAFAQFALNNLQNEINRLPLSTSLGLVDSKVAIELAISLYEEQLEEYNALETEDKAQITITNVNASLQVLNAKLAEIEAAEKEAANLANFKELLKATTAESVTFTSGSALKSAYDSLTTAQKAGISTADMTKYNAIIAKYTELANKAVAVIFAESTKDETKNKGYIVSGKEGYKDGAGFSFEYNGETYTKPLKLQSGTVISFNTVGEMTLTIKVTEGAAKILLDDKVATADSDGVITVKNFGAGSHTIKKKDGTNICYLTLMPKA